MKKKIVTPRKGITLDELTVFITDGFRVVIQAFELDKRVRKLEDKILGKDKK